MNIGELCSLAMQLGCEVKTNEPLSAHTTFKVGGYCEAFIDISSSDALRRLICEAKASFINFCILGNGSNVIFDDRGYSGVVFHIGSMMSDIELLEGGRIKALAGAGLNRVCTFACDNSLSGLEFAYGIPGSVGGAVYMNAGAYNGEIKDVLAEVDVLDLSDLSIRTLKRENNGFSMGYRDTSFMHSGLIILSAVFELESGDKSEIRAKMDDLIGRRKAKQPLEYPSAGSTFKRPEGYYAGKLIQDSGLRGYTVGGAQVSEKHCGFVVNKGGATSEDILSIISHIQKKVFSDSGVELECEIRYIPYE